MTHMNGYVKEPSTGVVRFCRRDYDLPCYRQEYIYATKESCDDYQLFRGQVEDTLTNLVLNVVLQGSGQVLLAYDADEEAMELQEYHFGVYLESCFFIKYDSSIDQILEDDRLDKQSFPALSQDDMKILIVRHLNHLMRLEDIHELFAYWKSLAKCDYIKFDSDLSGIFTRIKCEEKWPEVSDNMLEMALAEHLELLCQLSNYKKATGGPTADCKVPEILGSDLEEAIDAEYQARLLALNKIKSEIRLVRYHVHERFEHLVAQRVFRVDPFPKGLRVFTLYLRGRAGAVRSFSSKPHGGDVIGIDMGNTNARVAIMEGQVPLVIGKSIPSFFPVCGEDTITLGAMAKHPGTPVPKNTLYRMKKLIRGTYDDPHYQNRMRMLSYGTVGSGDGDVQFSTTYASILAEAKKSAEAYLRRTVSKAVVAVPINFSAEQRREIKLAGTEAELDVLEIIEAPIAATLSSKSIKDGLIAAFDLDGAAFSVSILKISEGNINLEARRSDSYLGGDDFDLALLEYIVSEIKNEYSVDVTSDKIIMMRLTEAAEKVKVELSYYTDAMLNVIIPSVLGPRRVKINFSRSEFDDIVTHLIERIRTHCVNCLRDAGICGKEIDELILVGSMTRIPLVQKIVEEIFIRAPTMMVNLEAAVVYGAALKGSLLIENGKKLLHNETALSLGIETSAGTFMRIISRNCKIPVEGSIILSTEYDDQESICIRIFQGERGMTLNNMFVGELVFTGIPPAPRGVLRFELTFHVATYGTLLVLAKHEDKMRAGLFNLPVWQDEVHVRSMVKEGILHGLHDEKMIRMAKLVRLRGIAADLIHKIEKTLDIGKTVHKEVYNEAQDALADLRLAMDSENAFVLARNIERAEYAEIDLLYGLRHDNEFPDDDY